MNNTDRLKSAVIEAIDACRGQILSLADEILKHPELGYKEHRTTELVRTNLEQLGLELQTGLALTGIKACFDTQRPGPTIAILGELDALPVPSHPFADPATGAAHACGHHAQLAMLLGSAIGLTVAADELPDVLSGRVVFMACPAEESVDIDWRLGLRERGEIEFLGGKQELIRIGAFDDIDAAILTHNSPRQETQQISVGGTYNGHLIKHVRYVGRSAHASTGAHLAVNALKAANIALIAIDAQRETFLDEDVVRIHGIITRGGDVINAVPADVRLGFHVRARRLEAIEDANAKVNRALRAGAMAVGATVEITTLPGYLPLVPNPALGAVYRRNAELLVGRDGMGVENHSAATTDMGDLSQIMPVIEPNVGGATGRIHGPDFLISDTEAAVVVPAKVMAMTVVDLLADRASAMRGVMASPGLTVTRDDYLSSLRRLGEVQQPEPAS